MRPVDVRNLRSVLYAGLVVGIPGAAAPARAVEVLSDLSYASPGGDHNVLDLYLPDPAPDATVPTVLFIHGGGWSKGDKADDAAFHTATAQAGYPVVACNYTLSSPGAPSYPQAVFDVKAVVRWIREEGGAHGLSPRIVAVGASAGGHLALMLGTTAGVPAFEPQPAPTGGYGVDAVVSFFGPADLVYHMQHDAQHDAVEQFLGLTFSDATEAEFEAASPIAYVSASSAPTAFYHGRLDHTVPVEESERMNAALRDAGVWSQLTTVADAGHGFAGFGGQDGASRTVTEIIPRLLSGEPIDPSPGPGPHSPTGGCGAGVGMLMPLAFACLATLRLRRGC